MSNLDKPSATKLIKELSKESSNLVFTDHIKKRMKEKSVTTRQVLQTVRKGWIVEGPTPAIKGGDECTLRGISSGKTIEVGLVIYDGELILRTTYPT